METIITIWRNRSLIWEGFINKIFKKDPVEKIYDKRYKICKACPEIDYKGSKCMVLGTHPCCGICGCSMSMKLRSLDSACPHPDGPKWTEEKL